MATIGTLVVDTVMRTNRLSQGAGVFRKEITSVSRVAGSVGQSLTGFAAKAGAVGAAFISAAKFVSEFNQQANELDRLAKHSATIGLTAQQLRALRDLGLPHLVEDLVARRDAVELARDEVVLRPAEEQRLRLGHLHDDHRLRLR